MPSKRTRRGRNARFIITEAVVDAFNADEWLVLHDLLGLTPWNLSPLDVHGPEAPEWDRNDAMRVADYRSAWERRQAIVAAGGRADQYHDHHAWMVRRDLREFGADEARAYIKHQDAADRPRLLALLETLEAA